MNRHQGELPAVQVERVDVGHQRHFLQKARSDLSSAPSAYDVRRRHELVDVFDTRFVVGIILLEVLVVLRRLQNRVDDVRADFGVRHTPQLVEENEKRAAARDAAAAPNVVGASRMAFHQRYAALARPVLPDDRSYVFADSPPGHVEDPLQIDRVSGVDDGLAIGQDVAHLGALVEASPTRSIWYGIEPILNTSSSARDCALVRYRTAICFKLVPADTSRLTTSMTDSASDSSSRHAITRTFSAHATFGPQVLPLAPLVVRDDAVGRIQDGLGRAVVLL